MAPIVAKTSGPPRSAIRMARVRPRSWGRRPFRPRVLRAVSSASPRAGAGAERKTGCVASVGPRWAWSRAIASVTKEGGISCFGHRVSLVPPRPLDLDLAKGDEGAWKIPAPGNIDVARLYTSDPGAPALEGADGDGSRRWLLSNPRYELPCLIAPITGSAQTRPLQGR